MVNIRTLLAEKRKMDSSTNPFVPVAGRVFECSRKDIDLDCPYFRHVASGWINSLYGFRIIVDG